MGRLRRRLAQREGDGGFEQIAVRLYGKGAALQLGKAFWQW